MDDGGILLAFGELLQAQSCEARALVARRRPQLFSHEAALQFQRLVEEQTRLAGHGPERRLRLGMLETLRVLQWAYRPELDWSEVEAKAQLPGRLDQLRDLTTKARARAQQEKGRSKASSFTVTDWATCARMALLLETDEPLVEAIQLAERARAKEIVGVLRAYQDCDVASLQNRAPAAIASIRRQRLFRKHWEREIATVELLRLHPLATCLGRLGTQSGVGSGPEPGSSPALGAGAGANPEDRAVLLDLALEAAQDAIAASRAARDRLCEARYLFWKGMTYSAGSRLREAEDCLWESQQLWREHMPDGPSPYREGFAEICFHLGQVCLDLHDSEGATRGFREALPIYESLAMGPDLEYRVQLAATLSSLGRIAFDAGSMSDAEPLLRRSVDCFRAFADTDPARFGLHFAGVLTRLGNVLCQHNKLAEAVSIRKECVNVLLTTPESAPVLQEHLAIAYSNLGNVLTDLGEHEAAEAVHRNALKTYARMSSGPDRFALDRAITCHNLGRSLLELHRFEDAEAVFRRGIAFFDALPPTADRRPIEGRALTLVQLGTVVRRMGRLAEARQLQEQAVELLRRLVGLDSQRFAAFLATALISLATTLEACGDGVTAGTRYREAIRLLKEATQAGDWTLEPRLAHALHNLGNLLAAEGKHADAESHYRDAVQIRREWAARSALDCGRLAVALSSLGSTLCQMGRLPEGEQAYREAIDLFSRSGRPDHLRHTFSRLGQLLLATGRTAEAADALFHAIEQLELVRGDLLAPEARMKLMRENVVTFDALVFSLAKMGRIEQAFQVAEQGKSRSLIDLLGLNDLVALGVPEYLATEYRALLVAVRRLEEAPQDEGAPDWVAGPDVTSVRNRRLAALERLRELREAIEPFQSDFVGATRPADFDEMLSVSRECGSTLVLLRVTAVGSFALILTPTGHTELVEIPEFTEARLRQLMWASKTPQGGLGWLTAYEQFARQDNPTAGAALMARVEWMAALENTLSTLYDELWSPVHTVLRRHLPPGARLTVLPNRGLSVLPLHACWWTDCSDCGARIPASRCPVGSSTQETTCPTCASTVPRRGHLVDEYEMRFAPSISVLRNCLAREKGNIGKDTLFAAGNPHSAADPGRLPYADWECRMLSRVWPATRCATASGPDVTFANVKSAMQDANVIHLACHAVHCADRPLTSHLLLADGEKLSLGVVLEQIRLSDPWLVTLSACESGLVDATDVADEHYGLPLGFLVAGSPTVFCSLWAVGDQATSLLMLRTYELLLQGSGKTEALREAQRWLRDATGEALLAYLTARGEASRASPNWSSPTGRMERPYAHPYFWAAFQSVGA